MLAHLVGVALVLLEGVLAAAVLAQDAHGVLASANELAALVGVLVAVFLSVVVRAQSASLHEAVVEALGTALAVGLLRALFTNLHSHLLHAHLVLFLLGELVVAPLAQRLVKWRTRLDLRAFRLSLPLVALGVGVLDLANARGHVVPGARLLLLVVLALHRLGALGLAQLVALVLAL